MDEPKDQRMILHITASQMESVRAFQHREWIGSTSEAVRQLLGLGLVAAGITQAEPEAAADEPAPTIPAITADTRAFMADIVFPWLRAQGKRVYTLDEVLAGVWPADVGNQPVGRDKGLIKLFQLMGWSVKTERKGGVTSRMIRAPKETAS
jgi:hypothetical protein